jgi:glutathionylspermidine synthase
MRFEPFALPTAAFDRRVAELRFRFSKWDVHVAGRPTVAPGALVLTAAEHRALVDAAEALYDLSTRAACATVGDMDATRLLGVPADLAPLARAQAAPRVTRIDFHPTAEGGWAVSEFNDDVPGGYNEAFGLPALFADAVEKGLEVPGDLPLSLARLLRGDARRVGLAYATAYAEDLQVVRLLAQLLAAEGVETVLDSPAALGGEEGAWTLGREPVERVFRFFPAEWHARLHDLDVWRRAVEDGLPVVNPFSAAWTQSKAVFAWLHEHARGSDRSLVAAYLPRTRLLDADAAREALDAPERWVVKPRFGRMGEGIVVGDARNTRAWRKALDAALQARGGAVLQERFRPLRVETAPGESVAVCVGAYVVDGRFAGYYSRSSSEEVTSFRAANVLTVVETV